MRWPGEEAGPFCFGRKSRRIEKLAFGDLVEEIVEFREADGGGVGAPDECFAIGAKSGDAEGHGDAMIAAGVDGCAVEGLVAGNFEAVFEFGDLCTHGAEIAGDESDAVGLFDAELFGVADANASGGEGSDGSEDGKLVDELRGERAGDFDGAETCRGRGDLHKADEFGVFFFEIEN